MTKVVRQNNNEASIKDEAGEDRFVIEDSLGYLVNRLARDFSRALSAKLALHDVSIAQWAVLLFLWAEDGPTQRILSSQVAIEQATLVRTIDRMERDGLVRRVPNGNDRRKINIFLTKRGEDLRDPLTPYASEVNMLATSLLSNAERDQTRSLLRRMIASLEKPVSQQEQEL